MIKPVSYQKTLEGKSNAHLITFDDGKDYVVKYLQPGFEKSLANEWVGYCLGRYLGIPIPYSRIVEIPLEFSSQVPELEPFQHSQYQFASLYIPGCLDGHQVTNVPHILNHDSLASIILFDYWLFNHDRTRKNILLREEVSGKFRLWVIDHAEVFGSFNWTTPEIENLPEDIIKSATHQLMALFIENETDFLESLEVIQTIPVLLMEEIVELIPDDWQVTKEEKKAIVTALVTRSRKILPDLIGKFIKKIYRPLKNNF